MYNILYKIRRFICYLRLHEVPNLGMPHSGYAQINNKRYVLRA